MRSQATYGDERLPDRIWSKVSPEPNTGCWLWTASCRAYGYGQTSWGDGSNEAVHRVTYRALIGSVPDGLVLDHLCRQPLCCNPAHLEPVSQRENVIRGRAGARRRELAALVTHCPRGHEYTPENARMKPTPFGGFARECKPCHKERNREYARRRAREARA